MYSENQAIQKKRDNVQTSALEWIINHLKLLQNNIISLTTAVNNINDRVILHEIGPFSVVFPKTFSVWPSGFAADGSARVGSDVYDEVSSLNPEIYKYVVDDATYAVFAPSLTFMSKIENVPDVVSVFSRIKQVYYETPGFSRIFMITRHGETRNEGLIDRYDYINGDITFVMDKSGDDINITITAYDGRLSKDLPPLDGETPITLTFYYTNA